MPNELPVTQPAKLGLGLEEQGLGLGSKGLGLGLACQGLS